jgi:hypothetical protein
VPQLQAGPHVHGEQVQLGLVQPAAGWPQVQSGPQVHGEQVQLGLSQPVDCSVFLLLIVRSLSHDLWLLLSVVAA